MSLNLDARQRAMLAEMGVAVWQPKGSDTATAPAAVPAVPAVPVAGRAQAASLAPTMAPAGALTPLAALTAAVQAEQGPVSGATQDLQDPQAQRDRHAGEAAMAGERVPMPTAPVSVPVPTSPALESNQAAELHSLPSDGANQQAVWGSTPENTGGRSAIPHAELPAEASISASSFSPLAQVAQAAIAPLMRAPSGPVADMAWPALREAVHSCQACGLCHGRTQTVFGVGAERADWMVVGEAPGEQEDLRGEPFVGQAGQLLDAMLRAVGKDRQAPAGEQAVFIANVLKCRPPGNRNPAPDEVAQCEPYLRRQVELVQPKLILALGRFAVQALLNTSEPIGRLRQQVHRYQGVPVVVSYHPAYLLRNLPDKAKAWDDLVLAMRVASEGQ